MNEGRITLVARKQHNPRAWEPWDRSRSRVVQIDPLQLRSTLQSDLVRDDTDVERIVLDQCCSEAEYLAVLSSLPYQFTGDVLLIRDDATGFLSATGRGGDRILYSLVPDDIQFYLETQQLVPRVETSDGRLLQFRPRVVEERERARIAGTPQQPAAERRV